MIFRIPDTKVMYPVPKQFLFLYTYVQHALFPVPKFVLNGLILCLNVHCFLFLFTCTGCPVPVADLTVPLSYPGAAGGGGRLLAAPQAGPPSLRQQRRRNRGCGGTALIGPFRLAAAALSPAVAYCRAVPPLPAGGPTQRRP